MKVKCHDCGQRVRVRNDGKIPMHRVPISKAENGWRRPCVGSQKEPLIGPFRRAGADVFPATGEV